MLCEGAESMTTHSLFASRIVSTSRNNTVLALSRLTLCTLGLSLSAGAQEATFITFDPPGSTGTQVTSINPAGVITGY
jgi:hypothetical protein